MLRDVRFNDHFREQLLSLCNTDSEALEWEKAISHNLSTIPDLDIFDRISGEDSPRGVRRVIKTIKTDYFPSLIIKFTDFDDLVSVWDVMQSEE